MAIIQSMMLDHRSYHSAIFVKSALTKSIDRDRGHDEFTQASISRSGGKHVAMIAGPNTGSGYQQMTTAIG